MLRRKHELHAQGEELKTENEITKAQAREHVYINTQSTHETNETSVTVIPNGSNPPMPLTTIYPVLPFELQHILPYLPTSYEAICRDKQIYCLPLNRQEICIRQNMQ